MRAPKRKAKGPTKKDLQWKRMFLLTSAYVDEFGELPKQHADYQDWAEDKWSEICKDGSHSFPVEMQTAKVPHLGKWRNMQCQYYKKGKLPASRIAELETIPGWNWGADYDGTWQVTLQELIEFVEEHGELPKKNTPKDKYKGFNLYEWIRTQRRNHRSKLLSKERAEQLEGIQGWTWDMQKKTLKTGTWDAKWDANCALLKEYVGKYRIPRSIPTMDVIYKDVHLGQWCTTQRQERRRGRLSTERQKKLESITGWFWEKESRINDPNWNYKLAVLKKFIGEYGRLPRSKEVFQGKKIGAWCHQQRTLYNSNNLPEHRIEELNKIPEWRWRVPLGRRKQ